jgi:hypothetical protein
LDELAATVPEALLTVTVPELPAATLSEVGETVRLAVVEVTVTLTDLLVLLSAMVIVAVPAATPRTVAVPEA